MVPAEDPCGVGEGLLEQRDGPAQVPGCVVGGGKVVAGGQGAGMVPAEDPRGVGEGLLEQGDGLAQVLGFVVGGGEVIAGGQGLGWSPPRIPVLSARACLSRGMARPRSPASW